MPEKAQFSIPFNHLKDKVLGKRFEVSLVLTDDKHSRALNKKFRRKDKPANVLTFPLSDTSGEIFIDLITAEKDAEKFEMTFEKFVTLLFIHGLLHLKGVPHGYTMERAEKRLLNGSSNFSRNRYRKF